MHAHKHTHTHTHTVYYVHLIWQLIFWAFVCKFIKLLWK